MESRHPLPIMGVRGKCWRVIAHFLENVKAVVRTNYGDSKTFVLREGVLQGTVLAAILFIIFLNPLIATLKPFCSKLNGLTLSPYLFADDLTPMALSRKCREKLIEMTILWTKRWKSSIKAEKSGLLTSGSEPGEPITILKKVFKELTHVIHLGAGFDSSGVFTVGHVISMLHRLTNKLNSLTNSGIRLGGIRADAYASIFSNSAPSPSYSMH